MTKMTVLHIASPFAFSVPMPKKPIASVHNRDDADRPGSGDETESGDLSVSAPASGADRVSALAGDGAPTRSQTAGESTSYDSVMSRYRDWGPAEPEPALDGPADT